MNLKAIFPAGATELTVNGLHQWDYGRKLDIHAPDLPAIVEVHFACPGMDEAIVRVGSAAGGVVTVAIPDRCLEQSSPITAWVYEVGENYGQTLKTLTLNIMPRTRPQTAEAIDPENSDKYTEAVAAMNEAAAAMQNGDIKAKEADSATEADKANKIKTIVITSYKDLMSYIPLYPNANYNSYAVAINDYPITLSDGTVLPAWGTGMLVVEADASLTLTYPDGSIISAFCVNNDPCTWSVKKLKQKPDEASKADSADSADEAKCLVLPSNVYPYNYPTCGEGLYCITLSNNETLLISIVDEEKLAYSTRSATGGYVLWNPTNETFTVESRSASITKTVCIAQYDF